MSPSFVFDPVKMWANSVELSMLLAEAQAVISMRVLGMAGLWPVTASENDRMVSEKSKALTKSMLAATQAGIRGAPPAVVMAAAIKPIRQTTRANSRRLAKRGRRAG